jgi:hypothetical protein
MQLCVTLPSSAKEPRIDPALIKALQQATRNPQAETTDLSSLVWLSSMSERLENIIRDPFYRVRLLKTVHAEAQLANLDPQLVLSIIDVESSFNRNALSSSGAQGLMQIMPFWKEVFIQSAYLAAIWMHNFEALFG